MSFGQGVVLSRERDRAAVSRAVRSGELQRLRKGGYLVVDHGADGPEYRSRSVARIISVHRQLRATHVFSHASAAVIWSLRRWRAPAKVHVVQQYRASRSAARDIARHFVLLDPADVVVCHDLPVTSLTRTVVDCALTMHPLEGLVIADSALRGGLDRDAALAQLEARGRAQGRRQARWVLEQADAGAGSEWETWLRYVALRAGLPRPETQFRIHTRLGDRDVDLAWPQHGVLAEFDGRIKYRDGAFGETYDAAEARFEEKRRADAIEEATGLSMLRVTARDHADDVVRRLLTRFPDDVRRNLRVNPLLPPVPRAG